MSNVEVRPQVVACTTDAERSAPEVLVPRLVPLGGPRAQPVRRTLPQRARSLIGAWCFADHYGPTVITPETRMDLPGHPHTGLQTVSWLFAGELEHLDTIGTRSVIKAGEMNLMTSGRGIAHSEFTTPGTTTLHGVQLWVALPDHDRFTEPQFEHYTPPAVEVGGARLRVFLGSLMGSTSPVRTSTPLLGAEMIIPAGSTATITVAPSFEHGILLDTGEVAVDGVPATAPELLYVPCGTDTLSITTGNEQVRALLLGGEPLNERIIMWWNFVGRTHDEIVRFRAEWQEQMRGDHRADGPYGLFPERWADVLADVLPAPELPNAQLKPRP